MVALHRALTGVRTLGPGPWPVGPGGGGRCGPGPRAGLAAPGGRRASAASSAERPRIRDPVSFSMSREDDSRAVFQSDRCRCAGTGLRMRTAAGPFRLHRLSLMGRLRRCLFLKFGLGEVVPDHTIRNPADHWSRSEGVGAGAEGNQFRHSQTTSVRRRPEVRAHGSLQGSL